MEHTSGSRSIHLRQTLTEISIFVTRNDNPWNFPHFDDFGLTTEFNGDQVYTFKKIRGMTDFSDQFRKIIMRYKRIGYNLNVMRQSACLVINPIKVNGFARRWIGRQIPLWPRPKAIPFSWLGQKLSSVAWSTGDQLIFFFCFRFPLVLFDRPGISIFHATHCIC